MADIFKTVADAAGIVRGKKYGTAGEKWRKSTKSNPSRKSSSTTKTESNASRVQRQNAEAKAAYAKDVAEAKAQGWYPKEGGGWTRTAPTTKKTLGASALALSRKAGANKKNAKRRVKSKK